MNFSLQFLKMEQACKDCSLGKVFFNKSYSKDPENVWKSLLA